MSIDQFGDLTRVMRSRVRQWRYRFMSGGLHSLGRPPSLVIVSHRLDLTGAPRIAVDMALEFAANGDPVKFWTYQPALESELQKLRHAGVDAEVIPSRGVLPALARGDTIVLNTAAHRGIPRSILLSAAGKGRIRLVWYIHEDQPANWISPEESALVQTLLDTNRMSIHIPGTQAHRNWVEHLHTTANVHVTQYRHDIPKLLHRPARPHSDFGEKLTFIMLGEVSANKAQLPIFYSFSLFHELYFRRNPGKYRDFELVLIGLDQHELSQQIRAHASALSGHLRLHQVLPWDTVMDLVSTSNVTICYSQAECLPLSVYEGMLMGNVVLRNSCSGMAEQLRDGTNGFYLDSHDLLQVVDTIERVLNREQTDDSTLAEMSRRSYEMALPITENSYSAIWAPDHKPRNGALRAGGWKWEVWQ